MADHEEQHTRVTSNKGRGEALRDKTAALARELVLVKRRAADLEARLLSMGALRPADEADPAEQSPVVRTGGPSPATPMAGPQFETLFRNLPQPSLLWRLVGDDLILTDYNDAMDVMSEGRIAAFMGFAATHFYADEPRVRQDMRRCLERRENFSRELRYRTRATNRLIEAEFTYAFIPPDTVMIHLVDQTERKRAEEALEFERRQLLSLFDSLDGVVYVADPATHELIYVNSAFRELMGGGPGDLCHRVIQGRETPCPYCTNDKIFGPNLGMTHVWEHQNETNGRWYRCVDKAIRWPDGRMVRYEMAQDVTDRRETGERLAMLAAAVEHATEVMVVMDADWRFTYVNPAFTACTGYAAAEVLGRPGRMLNAGRHEPAFYRGIVETTGRGEVWRGRMVSARKDGSEYRLEGAFSPIYGRDGCIRAYLGVWRDVTAEDFMERRLRQSQKMEAIGTLAGGIAHDFNNILAAIMGFAEIALLKSDTTEHLVASNLKNILKGSQRASELVRQILTFSRQTEQEKRPLEPQLVIKEACKLLRASLPPNIAIRERFEAQGAMVLADASQVHQLVMNLAANAAHAMRAKGGILTIELFEETPGRRRPHRQPGRKAPSDLPPELPSELWDEPCLVLRVADTGHGMDAATMERIFDPFFTTKSSGEGTGMGLATVHGIVEGHGGAVTVQSRPGKGADFHVYLPLYDSGVDSAREEDPEPETGHGQRVMLVDDEPEVAEAMAQMLTSLDYRVAVFCDPVAALAAFRERPDSFDALLVDMSMPAMSGLDLAREALDLRPGLPVVLCTGYSDLVGPESAREAGVSAFALKPLDRDQLAQLVGRALARAGGGRG